MDAKLPAMDLKDKNLMGILKTLAENNDVVWWNTFKKNNGRIMLKVEFSGCLDIENNQDLTNKFDPRFTSYKKMSQNQNKRNYLRAKQFRDQKEDSIEQPRTNSTEIFHGTPVQIGLDLSPVLAESNVSECFENGAVGRDLSTASDNSECFGECHLTHETTREESTECESTKPERQPSAMQGESQKSSKDQDQNAKPMECPSSEEEKHVCRLQDQVRHVGPCDEKYFICVKSRRDWYIRSCEFFERKNPHLTAMIKHRRSEIETKFKLKECIDYPPD